MILTGCLWVYDGKFWVNGAVFLAGSERVAFHPEAGSCYTQYTTPCLNNPYMDVPVVMYCPVRGVPPLSLLMGWRGTNIHTDGSRELLPLVEPLTDEAEYIPKKCLGLPLLGMATECCQEGHTRYGDGVDLWLT